MYRSYLAGRSIGRRLGFGKCITCQSEPNDPSIRTAIRHYCKRSTSPRGLMKKLLLSIVLSTAALHPQTASVNPQFEGIWEGYDGEWDHVSRQLLALAEAIPADKYSWRPGPGVRSVSEVLVHIAQANFYLLSVTGPKMPADMEHENLEKTATSKPLVIADLKRSLDAVRTARSQLKPGDLQRKVQIEGKTVPVDGMYLRIIVHDNEHMGQLIAYARMNGIVPPWSRPTSPINK
jgi:uncharacterized damage-inducible protein DinB